MLITFMLSSQYGNRTRVSAVRGRRLDPLTNWPCHSTCSVYIIFFKNASVFLNFFNFFKNSCKSGKIRGFTGIFLSYYVKSTRFFIPQALPV